MMRDKILSMLRMHEKGRPLFQGCALLIVAMLYMGATQAFAIENENEEGSKNTSGLPLPRFTSLRTNEVNMRTGPGTRYPIEWVYIRQGIPVEVTAEYEIWRRVRDNEGAE